MRRAANPGVVAWVDSIAQQDRFISVVTVGELNFGVHKLPAGQRRDELAKVVGEQLKAIRSKNILPISFAVAARFGQLKAEAGRTLPVLDSLIAATALAHGLTLATRNVKDFAGLGVTVVNPFDPVP